MSNDEFKKFAHLISTIFGAPLPVEREFNTPESMAAEYVDGEGTAPYRVDIWTNHGNLRIQGRGIRFATPQQDVYRLIFNADGISCPTLKFCDIKGSVLHFVYCYSCSEIDAAAMTEICNNYNTDHSSKMRSWF